MTNTTNLAISLVAANQAQKEVTVNEALSTIDAILNRGAVNRTTSTPPGSPAAGDLYIVGASPTGAWSGKANNIVYYNSTWKFIVPNEGMEIWVNDEDLQYTWDGSSWVLSTRLQKLVVANSGTNYAIDFNVAEVFEITLTDNCTFTFTNHPASSRAGKFTLILKQDATGSRTTTWPSSAKWAGATTPTLTSAVNAVDILSFITTDGGAKYYGKVEVLDVR